MTNASKHITCFFLIATLCFPAICFIFLHVQQAFIQHEMVEKLEREQLQKITLHNSSIQWYKKNKEIVINSTLFDVKSYTLGGDSTTFTGLFDEEETVLKRQVRKMFEQQDNNRPERVGFAKLVLQLWDFVNFRINIESAELRYLAVNPDNRNAHLISTFIFVPLPPPRV